MKHPNESLKRRLATLQDARRRYKSRLHTCRRYCERAGRELPAWYHYHLKQIELLNILIGNLYNSHPVLLRVS